MLLPLRCPLCQDALALDATGAGCAQGHRFDRARSGYLNLLPVQHKHSRHPGDDAAMVAARAAFLDAGHYGPLRSAVCEILAPLQPRVLVDSGCGEGWYTVALARTAAATIAFDISKDAIKRAARRERALTWLVASSAEPPVRDGSVDVLTAIFSPLNAAAAARVVRAHGSVVVVAPAARHLWELRAALYDEVRPHQPDQWVHRLAPVFTRLSSTRVQYSLALQDSAAVQALLQMTPYVWQAPAAKRAAVAALPALTVEVDVEILRFVHS